MRKDANIEKEIILKWAKGKKIKEPDWYSFVGCQSSKEYYT